MSTPKPRRSGGLFAFDRLFQDVRYALRTLRSTPGFTAIAVAILALGIGANTAIFSLVSSTLLRPLPFPEPERLVMVWDDIRAQGGPARVEPTLADFVDFRDGSRSFEQLAVYLVLNYNLTGGGEPERLSGVRTTTNLFATLGLQPVLGRTFVPDDEGPSALPVAIISTTLWERRFGADPGLVGRTITLDGLQRTVIGIVPPDFRYPIADSSVWTPAAFTPEELASRGNYQYYVVGRLKPGVTPGAAQAELTTVSNTAQPPVNGVPRRAVLVAELNEQLTYNAGTRPTLYTLLAAVVALLLITCANMANLLLARGAQRQRELAVRKALGAGAGRMLRQLLTESAVLAAASVAVGIVLSVLSFRYLGRLVPGVLPDTMRLGLDWRVLVFTTGLAAVTVLLFGAGPALLAARRDFGAVLKSGSAATSAGSGRLRNTLVVAEITVTVVLLAGAGLLLRSYAAVLAADRGFDSDHVLIAETVLSPTQYADRTARAGFYRNVLERVRGLPGVTAAGYANNAPLTFKGGRAYITVEGRPPPRPEDFQKQIISDRIVTPGYLETLGVPLLRGRQLDARDSADAPPTALINDAMVRQLFPGEDAVGRHIRFGPPGSDAPWMTIVGVVGDMRQMALDLPADAEFYLPTDQISVMFAFLWPKHLVVRTQGDPLALATAVRQAVWDVDAAQPVSSIRTMNDVLAADVANRNTQLTLLGVFAALALILSAVGLYGVLAYTVTQRTAEIALRMALGAPATRVVRGVVRSALGLALIGIALGLVGAFAGTRVLASFLYGVSATDPVTLAAVAVLFVLVTLAASYVPAWRAAHVDPATALRGD
ncbi:MAG: ABC transporter permease [Gammaproteobacteria bacterium]